MLISENPTSTARLETEEQFERLSQEIETKINEGLTNTLSQFESRLEVALESLRQTVSASLGGRSHVLTDQESDVDPRRDAPEGLIAPQCVGTLRPLMKTTIFRMNWTWDQQELAIK